MAKYKVLEEVEVLGELRAKDSEIEVDEETGAALVAEGKAELVPDAPAGGEGGDAGTPTPPPSSEPSSTGGASAPAPSSTPSGEAGEKKDWVGGHTVGANDNPAHKGGGLRESAL